MHLENSAIHQAFDHYPPQIKLALFTIR